MNILLAVLSSAVAVGGTLIGSWSTYVFQRRTAERAEAVNREERLRQERLAAFSTYAAAVTELKRGLITLWFRRRRALRDQGTREELQAAQLDSDRLGAAAEAAGFRLRLVADDPGLRPLMTAITTHLGAISHAPDRQAVIAIEARFEEAVTAFIDAAATRVR
ncbi:hypothetical protein AB0953_33665 [Streptomyces sp. NPDC046866]|uniref:hypothetical protein n=1 Tax=Streptomyces sp. NPDC046866 TaxID=3154921 RepID=UPI003456DC6B